MEQQFTQQLNRTINLTLSLSQNLSLLDNLVKKFKITPTSQTALSAYELVCKQYLQPKTSISSPNVPSSPQQPTISDVNDPELFAHFSFAKKITTPFQNADKKIQPERLFKQIGEEEDSKKGKSQDVMSSKYSYKMPTKNYISSFQLPLVLQEGIAHQKPEDIKQMSRLKLQETQIKQEKLSLSRQKIHLKELLNLITLQKRSRIQHLKSKSADFLHKTSLAKKALISLKAQTCLRKDQQQQSIAFSKRNDEAILQQCFMAWRQRAFMTDTEKQFELQIQHKYQTLSIIRCFRQLQNYKNEQTSKEDHTQQNIELLRAKIDNIEKSKFYAKLQQNHQLLSQLKKKSSNLVGSLQKSGFTGLVHTIKKVSIFRQLRQAQKIKTLINTVKGRRLIRSLQQDHELKQVYWKNPQKIILLSMVYSAISESMQRKGYQQEWMRELPLCLQKTDNFLGSPSRKFILSRLFRAMKAYLSQQSSKMTQVRMIHGKSILTQLLHNFKLSILSQKYNYHHQQFYQAITKPQIRSYLHLFRSHTSKYHQQKQQKLIQFLSQTKIKQALHFMSAHKHANNYYESKISEFKQQNKQRFTRRVFVNLKQIILTDIVNNKIVNSFRNYQQKQLVTRIFLCLKQQAQEQQIIKKRISTVIKLRRAAYLQTIKFNMRVALYGNFKYLEQSLRQKENHLQELLTHRKIGSFFKACQKQKLRTTIVSKIDHQCQYKLQWKAFNNLKFITSMRKKEQTLVKQIASKQQREVKAKAIDKLVSELLTKLLLKNVITVKEKTVLKYCMQKISAYEPLE